MRHVYINTVCVNSVWGELWQGPTSIVPWSFVFVCIFVYQEVESVHFGLAMFAEGQSGPVPKTSRWSQPNLGKYTIHASACPHTHTHNAYDANKQTWIQVCFSCPYLYFLQLPKHISTRTNTRFPTENYHLFWLRNRSPIHLSVYFTGERACA